MSHQSRRRFLKHAGALAGAAIAWPLTSAAISAAQGTAKKAGGKFAICNETFKDWPFDKAFAFAAECGYTGLEIAPFTISNFVTDIPAAERAKIRRQANQAGLEVIGLHWLLAKTKGFHLTSPDAAVRKKTAEYLGHLAEFCAELGGKILVFGSPQQRNLAPGLTRVEGMKYAAEVFGAVMPKLDKLDVTVALEPLSAKDTNFLTTAADGVELAKMVNSPRCKLHLDCKAMFTEPASIPELIRRNRDWMVHFHANDPNLQGPGFGKLDFVPIFKALDEIGYRGWISVEVFDYAPGPESLARDSIRYMQECMAKVRR